MTIEISNVITVVAITAFAGCTSFVGALISHKVQLSESKILTLTAFGAGLLMSTAIFQMVLEAEKDIGLVFTMIAFALGAVIFTVADYIAEKRGGGAGILLGIGLDSIPESLAIGASIAAAAAGPGYRGSCIKIGKNLDFGTPDGLDGRGFGGPRHADRRLCQCPIRGRKDGPCRAAYSRRRGAVPRRLA